MHRTMMEGLVVEAGRFRAGNVGVFDGDVLIHAGTSAAYVPEVMADMFGWLKNAGIHPLLASCVFHFELEFCHPFVDGNGRVGRIGRNRESPARCGQAYNPVAVPAPACF